MRLFFASCYAIVRAVFYILAPHHNKKRKKACYVFFFEKWILVIEKFCAETAFAASISFEKFKKKSNMSAK